MPEARRTLVKSPPELWAELSDPDALARHLEAFGEIKITRLEPESAVAWEGDGARGTVALAPSGWGTKVTVTAETAPDEPIEVEPADADAVAEPADAPVEEPPGPVEPPMTPPAAEGTAPADAAAPPDEPPAHAPFAGPPKKRGLFARVFGWGRRPQPEAVEPEPPVEEPAANVEAAKVEAVEPEAPVAEPAEEPPAKVEPPDGDFEYQVVLYRMLDALGSAHHRPFSRG